MSEPDFETIQLPFRGKIRRVAGTSVVTIPSDYINNNVLPEGEELQFYVVVKRQRKNPEQPD